ncbi:MAG: serine/threonine-protein kinase, partial [Deltaproteobacteria bacterium]|nr:serine/threonine-protein kinase [Deltaproteobacteria bacterium]
MIEVGAELGGRYRIVRLLGEGGMGAVYEAEHATVGRRVAIKVLHDHVARLADAVMRFSREARAAAEIGHPSIVEISDTGVYQGLPFLVMELLHGETLAERLSRPEPVSPAESCRIIGHVLSALASAHAKGIIHRDLKPENVYLVAGEGRSPVKLLDFGISKFRRGGQTLQQTTQEGIPIGTPAYMAPEQWMGRKDIDGRADIFAVGVMLYELLTGCLPYEGANQSELFLEIVRGSNVPEAPSSLERELPAALDRVVLRALDRDRDGRFPSAAEFLDALRPYGADAVVTVDRLIPDGAYEPDGFATPHTLRSAVTYVPRPRFLRAETLGVAVVVFLALGGLAWGLTRAARRATATVPAVTVTATVPAVTARRPAEAAPEA